MKAVKEKTLLAQAAAPLPNKTAQKASKGPVAHYDDGLVKAADKKEKAEAAQLKAAQIATIKKANQAAKSMLGLKNKALLENRMVERVVLDELGCQEEGAGQGGTRDF